MRNVCLRIHGLALILVALMGVASEASGQTAQVLMQFTNTWQYDQSGRNLAGTKWNTNDYVLDASWQPASRGLLAAEDAPGPYNVHAPINTPLTISQTVTTFYFRTTFTFTGSTNGMSLFATNLVDDGCVIYLNGREAGRVRITANPVNATSLATGPTTEGQLDVVQISPGLLRQGANLMAVEVHQSGATSTDIVFGMKLLAFVPTALTITNQPVGDTVAVGDTITLSVGVSGGPAFYQWQKDGVNLVNGGSTTGVNSNILRIANAQFNNAGTYRVLVTNSVTPNLISSPAVVNVVSDTTGPVPISAVIRLDSGSTNQIVITFNETVPNQFSTNLGAVNPANYRLTACGTANTVPITNITASGTLVLLRVGSANWNIDGCYYLTINNVPDIQGNHINPNTVIPVSLPITTNMTQMSDFWFFNANAALEDAFDNGAWTSNFTSMAWTKTNFVESAWWGNGRGILYFDPDAGSQVCAGDSLGDVLSFQQQPTLFRRTFQLATNFGTAGTLRLRYFIDDGMILYLNGKEIHRYNMPGTIGSPYTATTSASASLNATCLTNITINVTNLFPRTNWLAAAVFQNSGSTSSDTVFGMEMDGVFNKDGTAPRNTTNKPTIARMVQKNAQGAITNCVLSWPATNYGYALMYSTNIVGRTSSEITNWFTNEIHWIQVKDQSNPYNMTIPPATGPRRFYKLFHPNPRN